MAYKETQYEERRARIANMCQRLERFPRNTEQLKKLNGITFEGIKYSARDKIAWCHIAKVSSTT